MFPEIFRDEVFRLETRRLWLRWPMAGDATNAAAQPNAVETGLGALRFDPARIRDWRAAMEDGSALHLVLATKQDRAAAGVLHLLPTRGDAVELDGCLAVGHRGRGLMTEAVQALAHAVFTLAELSLISAAPSVDNPDGRSVLEHCGFTYAGSGMRPSRTGRGLVACDHFRLDHATWSSLQGWGMPGFGAYVARKAATAAGEGCALQL